MSSPTENAVSVVLPVEGFSHLARLVTGGFVSQVALGFEAIDDVQLAIELILRSLPVEGTHATVGLLSDSQGITVTIRPFESRSLDEHLAAIVHEGLDLRTYLGRLVDAVDVVDEGSTVVVLRKSLAAVPA